MQPPRQFAEAPQLMPPLAVILQSPLHSPLQVPLQCTVALAASMQAASHCPTQVPLHDAPAEPPVVAAPSQVPTQWPMQVPLHCAMAVAVPSHSPEHCAEQEPWHCASTEAEPSHVAMAMHVPEHWTESSPGSQLAVTSGGVQLALPVHDAWQLASADALTVHSPPEIESPQPASAEPSASSTALICAVAWLQASVVWASMPDFADQVSVAPSLLAMSAHDAKTDDSMLLVRLMTLAPACTKAMVSLSSESMLTCDGKSEQPCATCSMLLIALAALQPLDAATMTTPAPIASAPIPRSLRR
jgi:hypothetical protein